MNIELIHTGYFYADGGAMFGAIPKTAWSRRYPSDDQNGCILAMTTLLVTTDDGRIILIDTGGGYKHLDKLSYYRFFDLKNLHEKLLLRQINPEQVTDVILTHLHFDHCGYVTLQQPHSKELSLAFPNAVHWVSHAQWENTLRPNPLEKDSFIPENMLLVEESGLLQLIDTSCNLHPHIRLELFDGHTPGQIVPYITTPRQQYVFAGDVIPLAASISPEWISAYDTYPVTSYNEKIRMLEDAVANQKAVFFCHDAYTPCCTIRKAGSFYKPDKKIDF